MCEVPAVRQLEPHQAVARLEQRVVNRHVSLGAGVRLHVGVLSAEQRLGSIDRELLRAVDELASPVVPPPGIALRILVGENRALRLEHSRRHEVLRGDHLERPLLPVQLQPDDLGDLGIYIRERGVEVVGR
jgi:hypothetical protein